jgi:uncharacterized protein (TIGR03437 family)
MTMKPPLNLALCILFLLSLPLGAESRRYALILQDSPIAAKIASRKELRSQAALDAGARIEAVQQSLRQQLAQRKIHVTGSARTLVNAIFVEVSDPRQLEGLPGVRFVARLHLMHRHLDHALPLVKVPDAWTVLAGAGFQNPGAGIKIGIIDTGIDQTHPGFQDPTLPAAVNRPICNDKPGQPGNNDCNYTNSKVIVARSYVTIFAAANAFYDPALSRPDDYSPRDRVGHGTAAAMVAAGVQHQAPLATISGVAPKAYLGNYKIFGSPGVNDGTYGDSLIAALEDAYADGMDVVSLLLGSPALFDSLDTGVTCGQSTGLPCDVEAWFVEAAVQSGMMVVVSAGNDGATGIKFPALGTINSPGTAPSALTVGASRNSHELYSKVGLTASGAPSNLQNIRASFAGLRTAVTAALRDVASLGNDGLACAALPASSLNGAVALVQRDPTQCDYATKARNALAAGAVGVVIYLDSGNTPIPPGGVNGAGIPVAMIGAADGQALKTYLQSHANAQVVMDPALAASNDPDVDTVAYFSSRGPSIGYNEIKPEVVAPGTGIYTATQNYDTNGEIYSATRYTVGEGTSYAAPLVAGAIALVKQKTGLPALQLKSAIVNTASTGILDGGPARMTAVGGGKLNVQAAVQTNVTVVPSTLSFGALTAGALPAQLPISVYKNSSTQVSLAISQTTPDANAHLRLSQTTIATGASQTPVAVYLEGSLPAPGAYEGFITITGGTVPLRVPYSYFVGDNVPYNLFPSYNSDFIGVVNQQVPGLGYIALRAVDQYGVPVVGAPVTWTGTKGGTTVDTTVFDPSTRLYGVAGAWAYLGPNPGDQEFTATVGSGQTLALKFPGRARLQPTIDAGGVINAASQLAPQAGQGLAPGSYISVYGQNLAESSLDFNSTLPVGIDPYLPVSLANVRVSFDVPAQLVSAPGHLSYAGSRQINVQIPWELQGYSSAMMKVSIGDIDTALYTVPISGSAPALFENPPGSGVAVAQDPFNPAVLFTAQHAAQKDQWVTFYGNGLGPVDHTPASGDMTPSATQGLARCTKTITVTIGGQPANVDFAGLTPTGIGYYQINVQVPHNAPSGDQPVVLTADGVAGKTVTLRIQ